MKNHNDRTPGATELYSRVEDQLGVQLTWAEIGDVGLMLAESDEGSLLEFFNDQIEGQLTREGCAAVSALVEDFGGIPHVERARLASIGSGREDGLPMWEYHLYLKAVREFMRLRAELGERPTHTLGGRNAAWAHQLMDRLLEAANDSERCRRETKRLNEQNRSMKIQAAEIGR